MPVVQQHMVALQWESHGQLWILPEMSGDKQDGDGLHERVDPTSLPNM